MRVHVSMNAAAFGRQRTPLISHGDGAAMARPCALRTPAGLASKGGVLRLASRAPKNLRRAAGGSGCMLQVALMGACAQSWCARALCLPWAAWRPHLGGTATLSSSVA